MSGLPYKFEPGMRATDLTGQSALVVGEVVDGGSHVPGTRGLLLQQYRDASGHAEATPVFLGDAFGGWIVDHDPTGDGPEGGNGESEGAAILDALTRLAADRARESEQAKSVEGSEAIIRALLTETQAAVAKLSERLDALEGKVWR